MALATIFINPPGFAGTFVGNGGNAGDLELKVALKQLEASLKAISESESQDEFCLCNEFLSRKPKFSSY